MRVYYNQAPGDKEDYTITWTLETGDTISTSVWSLTSGITKVSDTHDTTTTSILVTGGTLGNTYDLTNTITTANGLIDSRTIHIRVLAR